MLDYLKPGRNGPWEIRNFEITKEGAKLENLSQMMNYSTRLVRPGWFTGLYLDGGGCVMSDTRSEMNDLRPFAQALHHAPQGSRVFISGLGLGIAAKMALDTPTVAQVDVMEASAPLVELVGYQLMALYPDKLAVSIGDVLQFKPIKGSRYNLVWHDIWPIISIDYWHEYKFLSRRWAHYADWVGFWARDEILHQFREVKEYKRSEIAERKDSRKWYSERQVVFP